MEIKEKKPIITKNDVITSSGAYPERAKSKELTPQVIENIEKLVEVVNEVLQELGIESVKITSGFRPSEVNSTISNAAKKSAHMTGEAIDILDDKDQTIAKLFTIEVLERFNLYREDYDYTKGKWTNWTHLQIRPTASGKRIFKPQ